MNDIIFHNVSVFDGWNDSLAEGRDVRVRGDRIEEVSDVPIRGDAVERIDCGGRVLMPGLIDAHVHVHAVSTDVVRWGQAPPTYLSHHAAHFMKASLRRGFTTLRDMGGADVGLASALRDGLLTGPRLYYAGRVVSQTGGHGDLRAGDSGLDDAHPCGCIRHSDNLAVIADGVDEVRRAVREELRRGASHIKIMGSGGVLSPTDPLERCQYSDAEIAVAVEEAARAGKYVASHCHPATAIRRSVGLGVRSIEHGTLIDPDTAREVASSEAFVVPTLATIFALLDHGHSGNLDARNMAKLERIADAALSGLEHMRDAGVRMGLGTDLIGHLHERQADEFELRRRVLPCIDILRSACTINAALLGEDGRLGCISPGACADLLVVDGNPLRSLACFTADGRHLPVILSQGRLHKRLI